MASPSSDRPLKLFLSYSHADEKLRQRLDVHLAALSCPDCLELAVRSIGDSLRIDTIHLFEPDAAPLEGDPDELLEEWQRRLALKFNENMDVVPLWPVDVPSVEEGVR